MPILFPLDHANKICRSVLEKLASLGGLVRRGKELKGSQKAQSP